MVVFLLLWLRKQGRCYGVNGMTAVIWNWGRVGVGGIKTCLGNESGGVRWLRKMNCEIVWCFRILKLESKEASNPWGEVKSEKETKFFFKMGFHFRIGTEVDEIVDKEAEVKRREIFEGSANKEAWGIGTLV